MWGGEEEMNQVDGISRRKGTSSMDLAGEIDHSVHDGVLLDELLEPEP